MANLLLALSAAGLVLALLSWAVSFFTSPGPPLLTENEKIYRPSEIPGLPHEHIPGGRGQIVGKDTEINSLGFRGPEFSPVKALGTLRVVVLGDSVVFGQGVEEPDTLPAQLSRRLQESLPQPVEVINAGFRGYNLIHYRILLEQRLLSLQPEVLVLVLTELNDLDFAPFQFQPPRATRLGPDSFWMWFPLSRFVIQRLDGLDYLPAWVEHVRQNYDPNGPAWKQATEELITIRDDCASRQIRLVALPVPLVLPEDRNAFARERARLAALFQQLGIPFLDPKPQLDRYPVTDLMVSARDGHPNARCQAVFAQILAEAIRNPG
jgi:lysophospholipase L1-like esterase